MLRTPVFHNKMTQYLDKLTVKNPDSIIESADLFISKIKNNEISLSTWFLISPQHTKDLKSWVWMLSLYTW